MLMKFYRVILLLLISIIFKIEIITAQYNITYYKPNEIVGKEIVFVYSPEIENIIINNTQTPITADLKVFFTDILMIAGWQNPQKKKLLED